MLVDLFIIDAPMLCASFYFERIDLASKLRKCLPNGDGVGHFQVKCPLTYFQKLTHQITLLEDFTHFELPFSLQKTTTTYFTTLKTFCTVFQISPYFAWTILEWQRKSAVIRQSGISDCGVFAVAYATSFSLESVRVSLFPANINGEHIYRCLEEGKFTMFPISKYRRQMKNKIISQIDISVYCTCRMPARNPMIECNSCHEWFHIGHCVTVSKSEMGDKCFIWNCNKCTEI